MAENLVPSLSSKGWITDDYARLDRLMSYFFTTDAAQSVLYRDKILSLPYDIAQHNNDISDVVLTLPGKLEAFLSTHFSRAQVDASNYSDEMGDGSAFKTVKLKVTVFNGASASISLNSVLSIKDGKLAYVAERFNNG